MNNFKIQNGIKTKMRLGDYGETLIFMELNDLIDEKIVQKNREEIEAFNVKAQKNFETKEAKEITLNIQFATNLRLLKHVINCSIMPHAKEADVDRVIETINKVTNFISNIIKKEKNRHKELFLYVNNNLI